MGRFLVFVATVLSIWIVMHVYVLQRAWPLLPPGAARRATVAITVGLGLAYLAARILDRGATAALVRPLEWMGASWMGVLLLLVVCLLAADLVTGFGLFRRGVIPARTTAVAAALLLSAVALVLGHLRPVVRQVELPVPDLPPERDGLRVVAVSDLHVGTLLGRRWTQGLVDRILALQPDLVAVVGDVVEGPGRHTAEVVPELARLNAPLGVWAVSGNHEYYAGLERSCEQLERAGFRVLRDAWAEATPGLVVAGVDDLTARAQFGAPPPTFHSLLAGRPAGAVILLSHTPWFVEEAAHAGVAVMISGHTHDGQIWPFGALVQLRYPYLAGHFQVGGMHLVVGRGTGTWGPRMRLWHRSEILLLTLRAAPATALR